MAALPPQQLTHCYFWLTTSALWNNRQSRTVRPATSQTTHQGHLCELGFAPTCLLFSLLFIYFITLHLFMIHHVFQFVSIKLKPYKTHKAKYNVLESISFL